MADFRCRSPAKFLCGLSPPFTQPFSENNLKSFLRFRLSTEHGSKEAVAKERSLAVGELVLVAAVYDGHKMRLYQVGELISETAHRGRRKTNSHWPCLVW